MNDRTIQPRNKRRTSALDNITQPSWNRELTLEFRALLPVLTGCVLLHPEQDQQLTDVCSGPPKPKQAGAQLLDDK
ncbi:hypothetical protein AB0392_12745 [Nonomuraea angiospora]|uniref:hypothetical protein n=1 Tax=Nonomuraea angiospora TaxID=46172 RepID=UPI00344B79E3